MITPSIELIKKIIIIETIYQNINIKKAIIISNIVTSEFINLLKQFDHNVCTYKYINEFFTHKKRLLIIPYDYFIDNLNYLLADKYLDTIFWNNDIDIYTKNIYLNKFKKNKIVIYNI